MSKDLIAELNKFIGQASKATYASGGGKVKEPWRKGFNELEHTEGDWYYRDSYTGFLKSWGQEVVWYQDQPFWTCLYGGGMVNYHMDADLANETFNFLKKVLSAGDKENKFLPRGPEYFEEGDWAYICELFGGIKKFHGNETITLKGQTVFTHDFMGGLVIGEDED
jgi:hypothetical protein